jgi:hypothetical protein
MTGSFLRTALLTGASLLTLASAHTIAHRQGQEPCAAISNQLGGNSIYVDPDTALACLQSVPLDRNGGIRQLEGLKVLVGTLIDAANN